MNLTGKTLIYDGKPYLIKKDTPNALCVGQNFQQELWVSKQDLLAKGLGALIGKCPSHLYF